MRPRTAIFPGLALTALVMTLGGQQTIPPVFLDHVGIILPSSAYAEMLQSGFLKAEFSAFAESANTAKSDKGSWTYTGIFLRGQRVYLECFEGGKVQFLGDPTPRRAGNITFNMSIENRGQLPLIRDRGALEMGAPAEIRTVRNAKELPSYDSVGVGGSSGSGTVFSGGGFTVRVLAYYPDGITREQKSAGKYLPERLLQDVTGITASASPAELEGLLKALRACGYAIHKDGEKQIASGPEVAFTVLPEKPNTPRILALDLSLNREKTGEQNYKFGDGSELQFHGSSAKWTFTFPTN